MKQMLENSQFKTAKHIVQTLQTAGHEAYFAGGCVRDFYMGRTPKDFDIATSAKPDEVLALFDCTHAVGAQFGVIVVVSNDEQFEVATFRSDGEYIDGRHPETVSFSTAELDSQRRDFTINGMMWDPVAEELFDWVGGQEDLQNGIIRAIGDPTSRFSEDKLRLLRAIRFAARFKYKIEAQTYTAIKACAKEILQVSGERIGVELSTILVDPSRSEAFKMMLDCGLLQEILPEIAVMVGVEQPPKYHPEGDVFAHTMLVMELLGEGIGVELAFAALLHDVGKPPTFRQATDRIRFDGHCELSVRMSKKILRRLKFSNKRIEHIQKLVGQHMRFMSVPHMKNSTLKRFVLQDHFPEHLELHRADCLGAMGMLDNYHFCQQLYKDCKDQVEQELLQPQPLLSGHDLIEMGYEPGPRFAEILRLLVDEQLEQTVTSREQAIDFVNRQFPLS